MSRTKELERITQLNSNIRGLTTALDNVLVEWEKLYKANKLPSDTMTGFLTVIQKYKTISQNAKDTSSQIIAEIKLEQNP